MVQCWTLPLILLSACCCHPIEEFWEAALGMTASNEATTHFLNTGETTSRSIPVRYPHISASTRPQGDDQQSDKHIAYQSLPQRLLAGHSETAPSQNAAVPTRSHDSFLYAGLISPTPLSVSDRRGILRDATNFLIGSSRSTLAHPFMGPHLTPALVAAYAESRAFLREYKPGFVFLQRPRVASIELLPGEGGMHLERDGRYHLFVYRRTPAEAGHPTIFQLVGMLETGRTNYKAVKSISPYRTRRSMVRAIGPDSLLDETDFVKV